MYQYFSRIYAEFCFSKKKHVLSLFLGDDSPQVSAAGITWKLTLVPPISNRPWARPPARNGKRRTCGNRSKIGPGGSTPWRERVPWWMGRYGEMGRWGDGDGWRIWWKTIVFQKLEPAKNHCPVKLFEFERGKWLPWAEVCRWNWTAFNCTAKMVAAAAAAVSPRAREGFVLKYYESRWLSRSDVLLNPKEFH